MNTRLLVLAALTLVIACEGSKTPTGPGAPDDPSKLISDGAHGGNKDFFFLPPLVSDPSKDPNFEAGQFNATIGPSLTVEICQLQTSPVDAQGQPVVTDCVTGDPVKKFPAGTVTLQNPPDGFYQVVWHVAESNLDATKFYRIEVLAEGSPKPFGVADVDPVVSMKELRNARTGEVIPLNENSTLPIKFRIEHFGGPTLCGGEILCTSAVVTNGNLGDPPQIVRVQGGAGPLAGALFPQGWLPTSGPQSVIVTIKRINTGINDVAAGTQSLPCHATLTLQQFDGCFEFTTTPKLAQISPGVQFAKPVTVAVCYVLQDKVPADPREKFAEMYASGVGEPPHALPDVSDAAILTSPEARNCNETPVIITQSNQGGLTGFASAGWNRIKAGLNKVFGVKTAYAVDLGLGGIATAFSRVGPAVTRRFQAASPQFWSSLPPGTTINATIRIVGQNHHNSDALPVGFSGIPVTFTIREGVGSVRPFDSESPSGSAIVIPTNTHEIDGSPSSGGGFAQVSWTLPSDPGTYHLDVTDASLKALDAPVTFTATVTSPAVSIDGVIGTAEWADATVYGPYTVNLPGGLQTTATVYLKNTATQLFGAVKFGQDLSGQPDVILALMMDLNANSVWDNNEDGFVVHQRINGAASTNFFDEYALCTPLNVCNEAMDTSNGGTNDGSQASTDGGPATSVEFVKLINTSDALDAQLVAGQTLRFFFFTNIGTGPTGRSETWYPSQSTTASYTVR